MFKIALSLIIILTISSHAFARQNVSVEDRIIGSTFKTLAKAFVAASDINRLKKDNIYPPSLDATCMHVDECEEKTASGDVTKWASHKHSRGITQDNRRCQG